MAKSTVILKIERFHDDEDLEFRVPSKIEKLYILKHIVEHGTRVALYYDGAKHFILTSLLGVNEYGMWVDVGPSPAENQILLRSKKITFISIHNNAKVQFVVQNIKEDIFEDSEAFYIGMPDYLLRIQRRGWFRISTPIINPIMCIIPIKPKNPDNPDKSGNQDKPVKPTVVRKVIVRDIGWEGVGLLCEEDEAELLKGETFQDCQISLPDIGTLTVNIKVMSSNKFTTPNNIVQRHVGCVFSKLDNQMNAMLQLYICRLEREYLMK